MMNNSGNFDDYLVWAILATIFCCLPFGIVAIV
ncbi:MAG: CD225/dispanin family protein, partial [Dethiobacteria bacterium]